MIQKQMADTPKKGHFQSSIGLQKHAKDEVGQRCPPPQKCVSPRHMTFLSCSPGCLLLQMKGANRSTAKIQTDKVVRVKSRSLYQSHKGKACFSHAMYTCTFPGVPHCTSVGLCMHFLVQTV